MQVGQAPAGEHLERGQPRLQREAKRPFDRQAEIQEADRPSEWAGFVYNPYSGTLLPPEGQGQAQGDDAGEGSGSEGSGEGPDAYSARRYT